MTALRIIGIILLICILIGLLRVGVIVSFGEALTVKLRVGLIRLTILPKKHKKPKKEEKPPEEEKPKGEKKKRKLPKPTLEEILDLISTAFSALGSTLRCVCRRLRIDPMQLCVIFGGSDPAGVAQSYGIANAAMWSLMPRAEELFNLPDPSIHLGMDYEADGTLCNGTVGLSVRVGDIFAILFTLAIPLLKWFVRFKKAHRNDPVPEAKAADAPQENEDNTTEKKSA